MPTIFGLCRRARTRLTDDQARALSDATGLLRESCEQAFHEQGGVLASIGADGTFTLARQQTTASVSGPFIAVADAAICNRLELLAALGRNESAADTDNSLISAAYQNWGEAFAPKVIGDWSLAAWHQAERRLFLVRDHSGNTSLYYYVDENLFAFATSRRLLLDLRLAPIEMDEVYLAQIVVSRPAYLGQRTIHSTIKHLPPAHSVAVTPDRVDTRRYWQPENVSELRLPRRQDYVAGLLEVFDRAVRERLPQKEVPATTLSGGLDSGAVSVTAAGVLRNRGERLTAYTSVPLTDPSPYIGGDLGDEFSLARRTAIAAGNIDIRRVEARELSPLEAIRAGLDICLEPLHGPGSLFWLLDLYRSAARDGHARLLTGQMGNGGISWQGSIFSQPLPTQLRYAGVRRSARNCVKNLLPKSVVSFVRERRHAPDWTYAAIAPDFARRLHLFDRSAKYPSKYPSKHASKYPWETPSHPSRHPRLSLFRPTSLAGSFHAELGAACGLRVTDPTADPRVVSFCLSVPDHIFIDPQTGTDRWLIREAMRGRLPDEVRLNRRRGRQAADLVPRLRAAPAEVESALDEIAKGPGAAYVSVIRLRQAWDRIKTKDDHESFRLAVAVLMRGIMAGLFVNGFGKTW
jgi:asparagine synthase (glutamine-hydrolysing)